MKLFLDAIRQDGKTSQAKEFKITLNYSIKEKKNKRKFFSEVVLEKVFTQVCEWLADTEKAK